MLVLQAFASFSPGWEFHAPMAKAAASSLGELLALTPTPSETWPEGAEDVLKGMHDALTALTHMQTAPAYAGERGEGERGGAGRAARSPRQVKGEGREGRGRVMDARTLGHVEK